MLFHYQIKNYYVYTQSTDMRYGIDALSGIIRNELQQNPLTGDAFVFLNKRKTQLKLLHWQGDGFAIFYKRLEKGTYELPEKTNEQSQHIKPEEIVFILQGIKLKSVQLRTRYTHKINN